MPVRPPMPVGSRASVALSAGVVALVLFYARVMRRQDEFTRTVHLSALAIAFPTSMLAVFAYGLLREEGLIQWLDPMDLAAVMLLSYAIGVAVAQRRYL